MLKDLITLDLKILTDGEFDTICTVAYIILSLIAIPILELSDILIGIVFGSVLILVIPDITNSKEKIVDWKPLWKRFLSLSLVFLVIIEELPIRVLIYNVLLEYLEPILILLIIGILFFVLHYLLSDYDFLECLTIGFIYGGILSIPLLFNMSVWISISAHTVMNTIVGVKWILEYWHPRENTIYN